MHSAKKPQSQPLLRSWRVRFKPTGGKKLLGPFGHRRRRRLRCSARHCRPEGQGLQVLHVKSSDSFSLLRRSRSRTFHFCMSLLAASLFFCHYILLFLISAHHFLIDFVFCVFVVSSLSRHSHSLFSLPPS